MSGAGRKAPAERLTASEAFAAFLYGAVASDGVVTHGEAIELTQTLARTSMFRGLSEGQMRVALARVKRLHADHGLDGLLVAAAPFVPDDLRETAYANCVDLVMADDEVSESELAYLRKAQAALGVPDSVALKIVEVIKIMNRG